MNRAHAAFATLLILASTTALADPPHDRGRGRSSAKWEIIGIEADLRELEKLARQGEWGAPNFQELYRSYLVSANSHLTAIKQRDPNWPTNEYVQAIDRLTKVYQQHTRQPPTPPPPPAQLSAWERSVVAHIAQISDVLVNGKLLPVGKTGYFDNQDKVDLFVRSALRADYRHERAILEHDLGRAPHLRTNATIVKFMSFEETFYSLLDSLIMPEIGRLVDTAYANRTRNKPFGVVKDRAALDLIGAVKLVCDHPRLQTLEDQARNNMNELARGVFPTAFHAENVGRVVFSHQPIPIGRENRIDLRRRVGSGQRLYAAAYFDKVLNQIAPQNQGFDLVTQIFVDGGSVGSVHHHIEPNQANFQVTDVPLLPIKQHVRPGDDGPAAIAKILSNITPGRHLLKVELHAINSRTRFNRQIAEGTLFMNATPAGLAAWSQMAIELSPSSQPPPPPPGFTGQQGNPDLTGYHGERPPPPPPPPPYVPPPPPPSRVDPRVGQNELPPIKVVDAGALREAVGALVQRFHKQPLKAGFYSHWLKGEVSGSKFRKITVWVVWPDEDRDGVADIESYEVIAYWNNSRWNPLQFQGPAQTGPHYQILVSKVH